MPNEQREIGHWEHVWVDEVVVGDVIDWAGHPSKVLAITEPATQAKRASCYLLLKTPDLPTLGEHRCSYYLDEPVKRRPS